MVDNTAQPQRQPQGGPQPLLDYESSADALISSVADSTVKVAKLLSDIIMQRSGGAIHPAWYAVNTLYTYASSCRRPCAVSLDQL